MYDTFCVFITQHAHERAGGYMIRAGVHSYVCIRYMYVYMYVTKKKFEWHFGGLLTFSNTHGRLLVKFID